MLNLLQPRLKWNAPDTGDARLRSKESEARGNFGRARRQIVLARARMAVFALLCALLFAQFSVLTGASFAATAEKYEASAWQAAFPSYDVFPPRLIAVDKDRQEIYLYEKQSPLKLTRTYTCTTGQVPGDKVVQGDLKTPEGIYFVVRRLSSGLDFIQYGKEAYTLNYPNPVDVLRRKTGSGIWIHGRGEAIVPLQTKGCVALNNGDIERLGMVLVPGTPVALASSLEPPENQKDISEKAVRLGKDVVNWAKAWNDRSEDMLDYYDGPSYSLATENFDSFAAQKKRLFKSLPWIKTSVSEVQVLKGPGYWVTWFYQVYEAPNLTTKGVRRLYWTENNKGQFRIIGMEWLPGETMRTRPEFQDSYLAKLQKAGLGENPILTASAAGGPLIADQAKNIASRKDTAGRNAGEPEKNIPSDAPGTGATAGKGLRTAASPAGNGGDTLAALLDPITGTGQAQRPASASGASKQPQHDRRYVEKTPPSGRDRSGKSQSHDPGSDAGAVAQSRALLAIDQVKEPDRDNPEQTAGLGDLTTSSLAGGGKDGWENADNSSRLPAQKPATAPKPAAPAAPSKEETAKEASVMIEEWRKSWEKGDIDAYMNFYADSAMQGKNNGSRAIRKQKGSLWKNGAAPSTVRFSDIRISAEKDAVQVKLRQKYGSKNGTGDVGMKKLTLKRIKGKLLITREDWSPLES